MANIKNFGLSGISADVQFGKAGGRVVYDAGNSVFKVTQADGSTLDNIRVATTPAHANDAASKAYVDSKSGSDSAAVQAELDATQAGAGLGTDGGYTANGAANYIAAAVSLKDADNKLDAALKAVDTAYKAADTTLTNNLASEAATRLAADAGLQDAIDAEALTRFNNDETLQSNIDAEETRVMAAESDLSDAIDAEAATRLAADNALDGRLDIIEGAANVEGSIAKAEADAKAYTDTRETAITTAYQSYADQAEADANTYTDGEISTLDTDLRAYITTVAAGKDALSELNDVTLTSSASGDLLMYNGSKWVNVNVDTDDIDEGSNLYYTDARARAAISVTDNGGDGSLSYNSSTGVISYTGPSAAEVRAHLSAGTGVSYSNGQFSIGQAVGTTDNVTFNNVTATGNITVGGALTVAGGSTFQANITGNTMSLSGNLTVAGDTILSEKVTIKSDVTGLGSSTTAVFEVSDASGADKLFQVMQNGDTVIGGVLTVNGTGQSSFAGDVHIGGNATVDGGITVAGDATFLANINANVMTMTGDLEVVGNTVLSQLVTVESNATKALGSNVTNVFEVVSSDALKLFEVRQNGDAIIAGSLTVNGDSAALSGNLTTTGNATVDGNLDVNGTLTVAGDATFSANIYGNNMTLSGNLIVGDADTDYVEFNADVASDFIPDVTGTFDLGTASKEWNNVYANNVYADLTGDVTGQISDITNHAAYIKGLFSVVDNGGDGALSYANGVITYTGPSASEVRAHFSAGTGVHYSAGQFSIGQAVETTSNVTFNDVTVNGTLFSNDITAADVTISGNLIVAGTTTTVNTETIALADNTIVLNSNLTGAPSQDAGIEVERGTAPNVSLVWDETTDRWTVGTEDFVAANFIGDLTGDVTGTVSDISNHDTDALVEGSTNLYYTDGRVAAYLTANAYATEAYTDAKVADKNSFVVRADVGTSGSIGTIANVNGKTYYVSRVTVKVTSAYDATVSVSDGTNTLMTAAEIEEDVVGTYVAELPFATATTKGATISLVSAATAGAATVTVEYVQL
jgi:hypothetical protein